jgi:hypothetical protein
MFLFQSFTFLLLLRHRSDIIYVRIHNIPNTNDTSNA